MEKEKMKAYTVRIPEALLNRLREEAQKERRSINNLIIHRLDRFPEYEHRLKQVHQLSDRCPHQDEVSHNQKIIGKEGE